MNPTTRSTPESAIPAVKQPTRADRELNAAIKRVYAKYGTDLQAFFADVQRDLERERMERDA